jgi:hypothetical protein
MPEPASLGPPWVPGPPNAGIVDCRELFRGRSRAANLEGAPQYQRIFLVRASTLKPNLRYVAAAPGINWRDPYPDDTNAVLVESNTTQDGDNPFHYKVTYVYRFLDETEVIPWLRPSQFSFSGSLTSAPAFWYYKNAGDNNTKEIIVNSAGDPLTGLDRDEAEFNVSISYNQRPPFNYIRAQEYVNAINSDVWSGSAPKTWKCQSITANRKFEVVPANTPDGAPVKVFYFETSISLAYRATGWDLETWDVGFNEIINGQRRKITAGNDPVSEPAALRNGRAKTPGQAPDSRTFRIYKTLPFTGVFEPIPAAAPAGYPYTTLANYYGW